MPKGDVHKKKEVVQVGTERQPSRAVVIIPNGGSFQLCTHTHIVVARNLMKPIEFKIELIESIFESIG